VVPSIVFALIKMKVSKIIISNRTREKAETYKKFI
jgi:shikimate 5-dehydrogenase